MEIEAFGVEDELFERVQRMLDRNKKAPARSRGKEEYLLTTKLFCGYCKELMIGYGGTGKATTTMLAKTPRKICVTKRFMTTL